MASLHIAGQTDVGRARRDNQDTFISQPLWSEEDALLVVIDGVGGYAGGAQAAALAKESIEHYMATPTGDTLTMLREAVIYANNQIVRQRQQEAALGRMCCVLTAAVADTRSNKLLYVHVGDTRLYRFRHEHLEKLTHDHSLVGFREDANQLTEREAMTHPRRNEILRDVGSTTHRVDDPDFLESGETDFLPGDMLILCSDGLTDMITRDQITGKLTKALPLEEQIDELIRQANEQGGQDNITVVLAHYPTSADVPEHRPRQRVKTRELPAQSITNSPPRESEPARQRTWKRIAFVLGLLVVVGFSILIKRAIDPLEPTPTVQPVIPDSTATLHSTMKPDSSGINNATTQSDSIHSRK